MRGAIFTFTMALVVTGFASDAAYARETEQSDPPVCTDPKHRHFALRAPAEPALVKKKEKVRVRRVLM